MTQQITYLLLALTITLVVNVLNPEIKKELSILSLGIATSIDTDSLVAIVLISTIIVLLMTEIESATVILIITGVIGLGVIMTETDWIPTYLAIEVVSLSFYLLAARERKALKSAEAGLKYFIVGALASGIILMGVAVHYAQTGTTEIGNENTPLIMIGLLIKLGAVPFHVWLPDVYEGSPTIVTSYFAIVPKLAYITLLFHISQGYTPLLIISGLISILIGAIGAINQTKIKRFVAYSSIGHVGWVVLAVGNASPSSVSAAIIYLLIYIVMSVNFFSIIINLQTNTKIPQIRGLSRMNPTLAITLGILMMSMVGVPPLAGFYSKLTVLISILPMQNGSLVAIMAVLFSVIAAFAYLRLVRWAFFEDKVEITATMPSVSLTNSLLLGGSIYLIITLLFVLPNPIT